MYAGMAGSSGSNENLSRISISGGNGSGKWRQRMANIGIINSVVIARRISIKAHLSGSRSIKLARRQIAPSKKQTRVIMAWRGGGMASSAGTA